MRRTIPDTSSEWRFGFVETYSPPFQDWIRQNETVNVKPGESIAAIERTLTENNGGAGVRLAIWDI